MFKKTFLSTLVSVFLTLLIFTVATAFGATTPSETPPNGMANPTFGGLTVKGGGTNTPSSFYGDVCIGCGTSYSGKLTTTGNIYTYGNIEGQTVTAKTALDIRGSIFNTAPNYIDPVYINDDLKVEGTVNNIVIDENGIKNPLTGNETSSIFDHPLIIDDVVAITGNTYIGTITSPKNLTVFGSFNATSVGSYNVRYSLRVLLPYSTTVPFPNTFHSRSQVATCLDGQILVSCGTAEFKAATGTASSENLVQKSTSISPSITPTTCTISMNNPTATASYFQVYAICFDPNS